MSNANHWEHFPHQADMGIRGIGMTKKQAFEQAALALTAVITDIDKVEPKIRRYVECSAPDIELLLVDWINAVVYEMAVNNMLFAQFDINIHDNHIVACLSGEKIDILRHHPAVEIKGATYTELKVEQLPDKSWLAQCVVDV